MTTPTTEPKPVREPVPIADEKPPPRTLSVVCPCYNEQDVLPELLQRLGKLRDRLHQPVEFILINDGSSDRTWEMLVESADRDDSVVAVDLSRNHGHQLALSAGLSVCRGDLIAVIDADLQDPPELIPHMIDVLDTQRADVVYGQRRRREGENLFKLATASGFYRLIEWLSETEIPRDAGDFRVMTRRALDVLLQMPERHRFIRGMVGWIGFHQVAFPYDRDARFAGETKYPVRRMLGLAVDAITAFSSKPLRLAGVAGLLCAAAGVLIAVYALGAWVFGRTVAGWTSIILVVLATSSVQLMVLGVLGEYLGRLFEELKGRPLFVIREVRWSGDDRPIARRTDGPNQNHHA